MERLLCIKIASRGDLLLAAPAFAHLRTSRPEAHVTLIVGRSCEDVALRLPYFDEIRTIDDHLLFGAGRTRKLRGTWQLYRQMNSGLGAKRASQAGVWNGFSEVFIFHRDWRYGPLALAAGIPVRRGLARGERTFFLTHPYRIGSQEHHSSQYLGLVRSHSRCEAAHPTDRNGGNSSVPAPSLAGLWQFIEGERDAALTVAAAHGFNPVAADWIGLGFGGGRNVKTRTELKTWPLERFRELAAECVQRGYGVVWVGDAEDAECLGNEYEGVNLAGRLTVPETAAVLGECNVVVANDTMALHLAEALRVPTVALFGPTDPAESRPLGERSTHLWLGPQRVPCSPCHREGFFPPCPFAKRCLREIPVEAVLARVVRAAGSIPLATTSRGGAGVVGT